MPKNSSEFLTNNYGFITDYLAEAFHHLFKRVNRYEEVSKRVRLGQAVEGRDERGSRRPSPHFSRFCTRTGHRQMMNLRSTSPTPLNLAVASRSR